MKVEEGKYSVAELVDWYKSKILIVNPEYQRGGGLWPTAAKSYFIDTILKDYPFPKVYFHELVDKVSRKPKREIVDGQQRLSTIVEFSDDKFALGKNAKEHQGKYFSELPEELQEAFWSYTISVDVIRNANRNEILQMFRRMNAFTLPLNEAEKRHSEFFGEFKDWVNRTLDNYGAVLVDWKVLTSRQMVRMADAEFVSDLALAIQEGVVSTSPAKLRSLYSQNNDSFEHIEHFDELVQGAFETVIEHFSEIQGTYATKPHVFHSLLCALIHNRFGLPNNEAGLDIAPIGEYFTDKAAAINAIKLLAAAHEEKDMGKYGDYVRAASEGGNRALQRTIRIKWLCQALRGEVR